ncbi:MAG: hypothetical protein JRJ12_14340 [Deltaproteobacteria bacterium]|nr:hypothetical protein [Deltaproteobacteria bacterium]MBW2072330.1 hypothetical protein [Deltaproteobacteria bacterium]
MAELGMPGSFVIVMLEDDSIPGKWHRMETWSYYSLSVQFYFLDGILVDSDEMPEASATILLANMYSPDQFEAGMNMEEVKSKIIGETPFGEVSLEKEIIPDARIIGSDQLLLGFIEENLVYVETLPVVLSDNKGKVQ